MTESPFPFGAVEDAPYEDEPAKDSKRNLIALGALAVVALAGGAFLFLGGGDDLEEDVAFTPPPRAAAPAAEATPQAVVLPVANADQLGRNPFKALYIQPAAEATDPGETTPVAPPVVEPPVVQPPVIINPPVYIPPPTSNPTPAPTRPPITTPPTAVEHPLVLDDVYGNDGDRSAVFIVDGKQMIAQVGTVFGPTAEIKLILLQEGPGEDQWTATLQVGDGDPFDVITGETVFVR